MILRLEFINLENNFIHEKHKKHENIQRDTKLSTAWMQEVEQCMEQLPKILTQRVNS